MLIQSEISHLSCFVALCFLLSLIVLDSFRVPWLQGFTPKPLHAEFANTPMMVSMLFDNETHNWKESLIHQIFEPKSASAVLSLPIPTRPRNDKLIWVLDSQGKFFVKSAY